MTKRAELITIFEQGLDGLAIKLTPAQRAKAAGVMADEFIAKGPAGTPDFVEAYGSALLLQKSKPELFVHVPSPADVAQHMISKLGEHLDPQRKIMIARECSSMSDAELIAAGADIEHKGQESLDKTEPAQAPDASLGERLERFMVFGGDVRPRQLHPIERIAQARRAASTEPSLDARAAADIEAHATVRGQSRLSPAQRLTQHRLQQAKK